ncbi:hypothetical protein [Pseudoduganella armeniaca]|uniref:hypothetical protein n=1 Tax=Pseudoduganella armeniaca TaxID=2072590 RepID=UPI0035317528
MTPSVDNAKGRSVEYHNTNRLVGAKGWDIGLSQTHLGRRQERGRRRPRRRAE